MAPEMEKAHGGLKQGPRFLTGMWTQRKERPFLGIEIAAAAVFPSSF